MKVLSYTLFFLSCYQEQPLLCSWAQVKTWFSSESEEQKRASACTQTLYELIQLPPELIHIIDEYSKGGIIARPEKGIGPLVALPNAGFAVSGASDGSIDIFDSAGTQIKVLTGHIRAVMSLLLLRPDRLISGAADGTAKIWDLASGSCLLTLRAYPRATKPQEHMIISLIKITEKNIAAGVFERQEIYVWDTETGRVITHFRAAPVDWCSDDQYHRIHALTVLPDSQKLISAGYCDFIKVWDLQQSPRFMNEGLLCSMTDSWLDHGIVNALVTLPGEKIASGWKDGKIRIFDVISGKRTVSFQAHKKPIIALICLSPTILASGSDDATIKIWDLTKAKEQCIQTLCGHTKAIYALAKVDDHTLLSASNDGTIGRWRLNEKA